MIVYIWMALIAAVWIWARFVWKPDAQVVKEYLVILERPFEDGRTEYKRVFAHGRNENEAAVSAFTTTPGIWDVYKVEEYIGFY